MPCKTRFPAEIEQARNTQPEDTCERDVDLTRQGTGSEAVPAEQQPEPLKKQVVAGDRADDPGCSMRPWDG